MKSKHRGGRTQLRLIVDEDAGSIRDNARAMDAFARKPHDPLTAEQKLLVHSARETLARDRRAKTAKRRKPSSKQSRKANR